MAGGTGAKLLLTNLNAAQSGNYSVIVSNIVGSMVSSNAVLEVQAEVPRRLGTSRMTTSAFSSTARRADRLRRRDE